VRVHTGALMSAAASIAKDAIVSSVDLAASPQRVFRALASKEVCDWWVRPGIFDTREWTGDVRPGGRWRATGIGKGGNAYALEGEFLEVDAPRKLVHTWHLVGTPSAPTTVSYELEEIDGGTRLTFRHSGFASPEASANTAIGWETSFARLVEIL
ncbi:MAG TPA: SRPBCC domain-containing protein, partial [Thermoanaerobaculia bacterium]